MRSLRLKLSFPRETIYTLRSAGLSNAPGELVVEDVTTVTRGQQTRVLRGKMRIVHSHVTTGSEDQQQSETLDVALKIASSWYQGPWLRNEAEKYEQMKDLQGTVIPRMHGLFHGATMDGFVTCLVMDYIGPAPEGTLAHAPVDYSLRTLEKLILLHDSGWSHGALREEHIVFPDTNQHRRHITETDSDGPLLISLSRVRPHHCTRSLPIVESTLRPSLDSFGCEELWAAAARMGIWNPGEIAYFSSAVPLSRARTPEQLAREAPLRMQSTVAGWTEALRHARRVLAAHQARYGPIEPIEHEHANGYSNVGGGSVAVSG